MDNAILRKKLNTFKSEKGTLKNVSQDVVMEVLRAWENWQGSTTKLGRELGLTRMQIVTMIQKAKRLVKSGAVQESEFREINSDSFGVQPSGSPCGIELAWNDGRLIRFCQVDQLIDFLKKVA